MPKIPVANFRQNISLENTAQPTRSIESAGIVGKAVQGLGQDIAQGVTGFSTLIEARQRADAEDFVTQMKTEYLKENTVNKLNSDYKYSAGKWSTNKDAPGYSVERKDFIESSKKKYLERADTSLKKDIVESYFNNRKMESEVKDTAYENEQRAKQYEINLLDSIKTHSDYAGDMSYQELRESLSDIALSIGKSQTSPKSKMKMMESAKGIVESKVNTSILRGGQSLVTAKSFLEGKTPYNDLLGQISTEKREKLLDKVHKELKGEVSLALKDDEKQLKAVITEARTFQTTALENIMSRKMNGEDVQKDLKALSSIGGINLSNASFLKNREASSTQRANSLANRMKLADTIFVAKNLPQAATDITEMLNNDDLTVEDAADLLKIVNDRMGSDAENSIKKADLRRADHMIKNAFLTSNLGGTFNQPDKVLMTQAAGEMGDLIKKGINPQEAANSVIKKYKGNLAALPLVPGIEPHLQMRGERLIDGDNIKKINIILNDKFKKGLITESELEKNLLLLQQRVKAANLEQHKLPEELLKDKEK